MNYLHQELSLAKTKQKNRSKEEATRGYVRELEKEIRSLRQQLRQFEKYGRSQDEEKKYDSEDTYPDLKPKIQDCVDCGKGKYEEFELLGKVFGTCNVCSHRKRLK